MEKEIKELEKQLDERTLNRLRRSAISPAQYFVFLKTEVLNKGL